MMEEVNNTLLSRDKNNFNLFRLLAAAGVIITHSYALLGLPENDWLAQITNGLLSFSSLGVYIFFIISGFLVANSLQNSVNLKSFFWKRFLRIFPALIVVLILTIFVVGPLLTTAASAEYFSQPGTYYYFIGGLSLYNTQYALPGVFRTNPNTAVNGSLWTLAYEWTCYVLLAFLMIFFKKRRFLGLAGIVILLIGLKVMIAQHNFLTNFTVLRLDVGILSLLSIFFFFGALGLELKKYLKPRLLFSLLLIIVLCFLSRLDRRLALFFSFFIVTYVVLSLAAWPWPRRVVQWFSKIDYSYGLYIYAFIVGQILVNYFHKYLSVLGLMVLTALLTLPLAVLSWHFIEKPCLRLKKLFDEK